MLLTTSQAADRLQRPVRTLTQWRYLGKGPKFVRVEGSVRYRESDLEDYLTQNTVDPSAAAS